VIYDPSGRLVRTLVSGSMSAGEHSVAWDGKDDRGHAVNAGIYFYELKQKGYQAQKKMLILK
jgi:flagellar hook assembly protein FlgD